MLIFTFTACNNGTGTDEEGIAPPMANTVISGGGNAQLGADTEGNTIIKNLADGNYAEWIVELTDSKAYSVKLEYSSQNKEFACKVELYSEDGKLQAEAEMTLESTNSAETFDVATAELGEDALEKGMYTLIVRPSNMEMKAINIKSVRLI